MSVADRPSTADERLEELRGIIAEVLEIDPEDLADTSDFMDDHDADSLRAIEILARIDKRYKVEIPQTELPELRTLKAVYHSLSRHAGWRD